MVIFILSIYLFIYLFLAESEDQHVPLQKLFFDYERTYIQG